MAARLRLCVVLLQCCLHTLLPVSLVVLLHDDVDVTDILGGARIWLSFLKLRQVTLSNSRRHANAFSRRTCVLFKLVFAAWVMDFKHVSRVSDFLIDTSMTLTE